MAWLTGWTYRQSHTIAGSTDGAQTDYQMKITVNYSSGSSSGDTIYVSGNCKTDFSDIRFTDSDETTVLDYWIEDYTASTSAIIWIKVPTIPASPSNDTIYCYYDNSGASSLSNGSNTFNLFDHFDDTSIDADWNTTGTPTESGTTVSFNGTDGMYSSTTFGDGYAVHARAKADEQDTMFVRMQSDNDVSPTTDKMYLANSDYLYPDDFDRMLFTTSQGSGDNNTYTDGLTDFRNTYFIWKLLRLTGNCKGYMDDTLVASHTSNIPDANTGIGFLVYNSSQESQLDVDWVFVRKLTTNEPTSTSWGNEETEGGTFYINDTIVTGSPVVITGDAECVLRVDWHDNADLDVSAYTVDFWVRSPDDTTLGPYAADTYTKEESQEYNAQYTLNPPDAWTLGTYDLKAKVQK